jgi:hypothetical protein
MIVAANGAVAQRSATLLSRTMSHALFTAVMHTVREFVGPAKLAKLHATLIP